MLLKFPTIVNFDKTALETLLKFMSMATVENFEIVSGNFHVM
jgi:hypothetical protein